MKTLKVRSKYTVVILAFFLESTLWMGVCIILLASVISYQYIIGAGV